MITGGSRAAELATSKHPFLATVQIGDVWDLAA
jgi:hypothetical protein